MGSVGTRAFIALMFGRDQSDPLFLQIKEAQASVLQGLVGPNPHTSNGERVVHGQHLMQAESDIFLGWTTTVGVDGVARDYYFRQLHDWKGSATVETMTPAAMSEYGRICAWALARAHARSGDRIALASYLGSSDVFDRAIAEFSEAYADQNERGLRRPGASRERRPHHSATRCLTDCTSAALAAEVPAMQSGEQLRLLRLELCVGDDTLGVEV